MRGRGLGDETASFRDAQPMAVEFVATACDIDRGLRPPISHKNVDVNGVYDRVFAELGNAAAVGTDAD